MGLLNPTAKDRRCDAQGRPYFLWDLDLDEGRFRVLLLSSDADVRAHFIAKMMRQAKPDDVFEFVTLAEIVRDWELVKPQLGKRREFWSWLLERWRAQTDAA